MGTDKLLGSVWGLSACSFLWTFRCGKEDTGGMHFEGDFWARCRESKLVWACIGTETNPIHS